MATTVAAAEDDSGRDLKRQQDQPIRRLPEQQKRYALIIGVDRYEDSQITPLLGASNDARTLREVLIRRAGFPSEQIILLASDQPAERRPTRGNILRRLSNLKAAMPKDGLLLVSFAGHGIQRGTQAYLLCADSQLSGDMALLEDTAINVTAMRDRIRESAIQQVLLILDACRNEPGGRAEADNPLTAAFTRGLNFHSRNREISAFVILYASDIGHRAYEYIEKKQGYFSWFLVEGLKGAAANEKGEVTLAGLVRYLQEQVPRRVLLDLGPGREQKPWAVVDGYKYDELVLSAGAPIPGAQTGAGLTAETALWRQIEQSNKSSDYQAYLETYPGGRYVSQARQRYEELVRRATPQPQPNVAKPLTTTARLSLRSVSFQTAMSEAAEKPVARRTERASQFVENCAGIPLEMISIGGGTFPMGLTRTEVALYQQQVQSGGEAKRRNPVAAIQGLFRMMMPQHLVSVPSFFLAKFEVTQAQWRAVARLPRLARNLEASPASVRGDSLPVDQVSWEEAVEFCARLSRQTGREYRLPSEAEWEYACRAGTTTPYHFGESISPDLVNYNSSDSDSGKLDGMQPSAPAPVGSRGLANGFGLYDMHGNVQEWCLDLWHNNYQRAPVDGSVWEEGGDRRYRVVRGGSWLVGSPLCRSSERDRSAPTARDRGTGFRIVMTSPKR
ncbi:MAG: SUMF1/EgtB/PvdO family nonheme iron enzyme [Acidobacteria bacterium]|nr:SUMF1/EgtB/PvdO family nonheme iron enzyme [Acidobacteriota bacterium]